MSTQRQFSSSVLSHFDLIAEQMQTLSDIIIVTMNIKINRLDNEFRQLLQAFVSQQSHKSEQTSDFVDHRSQKNWIAKKVEFFDFTAEKIESVINFDKHVFYKNVYAFVNRLKNVNSVRKEDKLRFIISQCLRDTILIWHSTEISNIERKIYRNMFLQNWYNVLIKRFKERASMTLNYLQFIKYTLFDARKHKNSRIYAQNLFRYVKTADLITVYNQLVLAWNNLNWQFKQHIVQSIEIIIIQIFLEQLNNNCDIWFKLINANQFIFKRYNKQTSDKYTDRHFNNDRYFSFKNIAYQKNSQNRQISQIEIIIKLKNSKFKSSEREFERNSRNNRHNRDKREYDKNKKDFHDKDRRNYDKSRKNYDRSKYRSRNKNREKNKNKEKAKTQTYMTQKKDDHENSNCHDLNYFDSDYKESNDSKCIIDANYTSLEIICRRCQSFFSSNNLLHKHIRINVCFRSLFNFSKFKKNITTAYSTRKVKIIRSKINLNKNIESEYDFKEWQYVTASIALNKNETSKSACLDTEVEVILIDIQYFKNKFKNISIRTIISSITIRDLRSIKHSTNKYACCLMYFSEKNEDDQSIFAEIIKKIHLIDNLKVNLLIDNNVLNFELIDIFIFINTVFIENCNVIVSIVVKFRSFSQTKSIHTTKENKISSHSKLAISIHKIVTFDRDYIFESKKIANFAVYAHLMNYNIKTILVRNDIHNTVQISRNFRLRNLIEIDFSNAMHVDTDHFDLILKRSKYFHKSSWLQKVFKKTTVFHVDLKSDIFFNLSTKHSNKIIIHRFFVDAVEAFIKIIDDYTDLWSNQEFANLSQKNWMQILLRDDWEKIIKEKAKVYSLKAKDRLIVDEIFDKLHDQERLSWITESFSFSFSCFVVWKNSSNNRKNRIVVDIRILNAVFLSDFYFISLQSEIIQAVHDCTFIFTIDCISFFYQWRIHLSDRHKMTVVTHKN